MKLRLPSLLASSLLACVAASTSAYADIFTAEGVSVTGSEYGYYAGVGYATMATLGSDTNRFYDGGKGTYWDGYNSTVREGASELFEANGNSFSFLGDLETRIPASSSNSCTASSFQNLTNDGGQCWAYTSSNLLQYWQSYYGVFAKKARDTNTAAPVHGYTYDQAHLDKLGGTQSLKLNMTFYDNWVNQGGDSQTALAWYLGGKVFAPSRMQEGYESAGYFADYFTYTGKNDGTGNDYSDCFYADTSLAKFSEDVKKLFGNDDNTKGQIVHLDLTSSSGSGHAITCYGYETDENGNITAVYIANSDDQAHGLLKLTVKWEQMQQNGYTVTGAVLYDGSYKWQYASKDWRITSMNSINTPEVLKNMLAEYESGNLTWMGNLSSWTNTATVAADVDVLPTDETGWMTYAGAGTEHAGYYNTYYTTGRGVEFNDEATSSTVSVAEDISVSSMAVNNTELDYVFNGGDTSKTITIAGAFTKSGSGAVEFNNIALSATSANLEGDVTFDQITINGEGAFNANGHTVTIKGDSSLHVIDQGTDAPQTNGQSTLVVTGGTTELRAGVWTNLKSLVLSEEARLKSNASVCVAGNISTTDTTTATLAEGVNAGIETRYCLAVGTEGDATTGNVNLAGDITAGAYINILRDATITKVGDTLGNVSAREKIYIGGNADIAGNLTSYGKNAQEAWGQHVDNVNGSYIEIGGNAKVGGNLSATSQVEGKDAYVTIGGNAEVGGKLTASQYVTIGGNAKLGADSTIGSKLTVGGNLTGTAASGNVNVTAGGDMQLGGNVSKVNLTAKNITMAAKDGSELTLDTVNMTLTGGEVTLTNVVVRGDSSFLSGVEGQAAHDEREWRHLRAGRQQQHM